MKKPDISAAELAELSELLRIPSMQSPAPLELWDSDPFAPEVVPAVVTGFDVPSGNVHAPNERMRVANLGPAVAAARELLRSFGQLNA